MKSAGSRFKDNWERLALICKEYAEFFDFFDNDKEGEWAWTRSPYENILDLGMGLAMAADMIVVATLGDKRRDCPSGTHEQLSNAVFTALGDKMRDLCGEDILGWPPASPKSKKKSRSTKGKDKRKKGEPSFDRGDLKRQILALLEGGKNIDAIKLYREKMGCGLKEARDALEALAAKHYG